MESSKRVMGLLGLATRAGKIYCGTEAVTESIEKHKAKLVIIATDSSEKTKSNFQYLCNEKTVPVIEYSTIEEISKAIGKENKAVLSVKDRNFANEISKIICGGENNGEN